MKRLKIVLNSTKGSKGVFDTFGETIEISSESNVWFD